MTTPLMFSPSRLLMLLICPMVLVGCSSLALPGSRQAATAPEAEDTQAAAAETVSNLKSTDNAAPNAPLQRRSLATEPHSTPPAERPPINAKSLPPVPQKLPSEELQNWERQMEPGAITPEQVQQRVPTEALVDWLTAAYAAGIDPEQVQTALPTGNWHLGGDTFQVRDLDGDGEAEWLMTVYMYDPEQAMWGSPGDFWIIGDDGLEYRFFTPDRYFDGDYETQPEFGLSAPRAIAIDDMTGDGRSEIVLQRSVCGAHTCTYTYYILSDHSGTLTNAVRLDPNTDANHDSRASVGTIYMPYAEVQPLEDETGDGLPDLLVYGGWVGSAGSGIQRPRTEIWSWDGDAIALAETRLDPTEYRFHILWEANDQFDAGNVDWAYSLYNQVLTNDTLKDEAFVRSEAEVKADTQLFAGFRLTLLSLMQSSEADAQRWYGWMRETYPNAKLTAAATLLIDGSREASLETTCETVTDYLKQFEVQEGDWITESPTGALQDMGYANPRLTAVDICPL